MRALGKMFGRAGARGWYAARGVSASARAAGDAFGGERVGGCVRWDVDIKPPQAEGGFGDGMTAADLYGLDVGSYHVALPRLEMKIDLSNLEAARERAEREAAETTY